MIFQDKKKSTKFTIVVMLQYVVVEIEIIS